jgi:predicted metal-dependent peptidase
MINNSAEAVLEQLTRARISLLLQQPFWGTLATRLILRDATDDPWCKTAATDGRYFYYNRDFISKLDRPECIFLVGHEVEHCVYDHMDRRGSRKPKMWNAAADYVINCELDEHHIGVLPNPKTSGVTACFDKKYKGMCTEEVYELLLKDPNSNWPEFDIHLEPGDGKGEPMTEEEQRVLSDEIRNAVMQAAKAAGAGHTPAGVRRLLKDLVEPQMDWREVLNMKLQSMVKADFTWDRCSRKMQASGIYLPATKNDFKVKAAVGVDASGSMSDDMLRDLLTETKGIMQQFMDFELEVWTFDTKVYNYQKFTPDTLDDIDQYDIKGGGGTDFMCNWKFMKEKGICPERFIMMTDGYPCGSWGDPDYCDTLFLIHGDPGRKLVAPFGMTAWYEADSHSPQNRKK